MSLDERLIEFKWTSIWLIELKQAKQASMSLNGRISNQMSLKKPKVWMNLNELRYAWISAQLSLNKPR